MPTTSLSVVVAVHNGAATLTTLVERLASVLESAASEFEVMLVNDGSEDGSWEKIKSLAARHAWVRGVDLTRNQGQHNALLCGIRRARHARVVTLDDDLQHPPEEIPALLAQLAAGSDLVYGTSPRLSRASRITRHVLCWTTGEKRMQQAEAFRAFDAGLGTALVANPGPRVCIDVLLARRARAITSVPTRHDPRLHGSSGYGPRKRLSLWLAMLACRRERPRAAPPYTIRATVNERT
ncbi:MAG: glycosyltransferase family 2 protein [bacterium]|nr:glycosyltransferase family 2 protein [bacterium]